MKKIDKKKSVPRCCLKPTWSTRSSTAWSVRSCPYTGALLLSTLSHRASFQTAKTASPVASPSERSTSSSRRPSRTCSCTTRPTTAPTTSSCSSWAMSTSPPLAFLCCCLKDICEQSLNLMMAYCSGDYQAKVRSTGSSYWRSQTRVSSRRCPCAQHVER